MFLTVGKKCPLKSSVGSGKRLREITAKDYDVQQNSVRLLGPRRHQICSLLLISCFDIGSSVLIVYCSKAYAESIELGI